jgi:hypothetical protein
MKHITKISLWLALLGLTAINSQAQVVIGSWQTGQSEGWLDNSDQLPITDPSNTNKYSFVKAGVPGYQYSLQITDPGYNTDLYINLTTLGGEPAGFEDNAWLTFTFSVPAWTNGGYSQIANVLLNAQGFYGGMEGNDWVNTVCKGNTGANYNNGSQPNYYFYNGIAMQTQVVSIDYSSYVSQIQSAGAGWIEVSFTENNGGGAPPYYFLNNVVLSTAPFGIDAASPPPTMGGQPAKPELRIFAGSTANTYDRAEIDTAPDGDESWIGSGHYPVTYSFTLLDFPVAPPMQCQIFLIPEGSLGSTPYTGNEYVDYNAPNELWLEINGMQANADGSSGYNAQVAWKVGAPNTNPNNQALTPGNGVAPSGIYANQGNQSPVGTWTLKFTGPADGTLTPPGVNPLPFHISDPNLATDFASPVLAVFGLQPNSGGGEGTYIDYASISIAGTANPISENFTSEAPGNTIESSGLWDTSDSAGAAPIQLVTTETPLWVSWTLPAIGWGLGESPYLPITQPPGYIYSSPNGVGSFVLPEQFNGYSDSPVNVNQGGTNWTLIPSDCLPSNEFPTLTNAYFQLVSPPPGN